MGSLIPGFSYDIFISYRQKDNKYDGWVTEFVANLQKELEATFKEDVSIYFDENPHDGLLENHDVGDSLREKLKCALFIPIISQTYCDPKSFAWNHEFLAFKKLAASDPAGLKIRLDGGNTSSRILPVRIHDLGEEDRMLLEQELGPLRAIDFIFRSAGVNRSLRAQEDHPQDNLNKTYYRDQINKVANAVKEMIRAMRGGNPISPQLAPTHAAKRGLFLKKNLVVAAAAIVALGAWGLWKMLGPAPVAESVRKSRIAVLPLENKTNEPQLDIFGDMAADWVTQGLMSFEQVNVVSFQTIRDNIQYATVGTGKEFVDHTGAETIIRGRYYLQGENIIIQAQFTDAVTGEVKLVIPAVSGSRSNLERLVNDLKDRVMTEFELTQDKMDILMNDPPKYEAYLQYEQALVHFGYEDIKTREFLLKAITIDSNFFYAYTQLAYTYLNAPKLETADSLIKEIDRRFPHLPVFEQAFVDEIRESVKGNMVGAFESMKKAYARDSKSLFSCYLTGLHAYWVNRPREATRYFSSFEANDILFKNKANSWWHAYYARALIRLNQFDEALKILRLVPIENASTEVLTTKAHLYKLLGQEDSIRYLVSALQRLAPTPDPIPTIYNTLARKSGLGGQTEERTKWAVTCLEYISAKNTPTNPLSRIYALYLADRFAEVRKELEPRVAVARPAWNALAVLGCTYAKLGMRDKALEIVNQLGMDRTPYPQGKMQYGMAYVLTALGDREKAMQALRTAFAQGFTFEYQTYDGDYFLVELLDYPPFQEFTKPKG